MIYPCDICAASIRGKEAFMIHLDEHWEEAMIKKEQVDRIAKKYKIKFN
jgi:hypothetical protein